jgi:DNA helicase-2/ATP-dependent DNA helicase PcrA
VTWSDELSGPHLQIASSDRTRIGVLAGPGTGKTSYGLMRRVARLLEEGVAAEEILLISFTRTAAHDLRTKVADLGVEGAEEVRATTLHAYCFGLLQRSAVLAITGRAPRPLLDHEVDMMLRDLSGNFGDIYERRARLHAFEAGWARETTTHPGLTEPGDDEFQRNMLRWLRRHKAMLVGEVVPIAYAFLRDNPMSEERRRYKHVVVDEYQDLNTLEQHLLDLLAQEASLCIAGDDDQSIYGFRYANPDGILGFRNRGGWSRSTSRSAGGALRRSSTLRMS